MKFKDSNYMARAYDRYVELGGRKRIPENLCRFVRVALIWSPLKRFCKGQIEWLECTPFFAAMLSLALVMACTVITYLAYCMFFDWILAVGVVDVGFLLVCLAFLLKWLDDGGEHRIRDFKESVIESIQAISSYRKAKAGRLCPLIEIERTK